MSNAVDKWKGKMRRSTTGEAVEALLSGTAIAPSGTPSTSMVPIENTGTRAGTTSNTPAGAPPTAETGTSLSTGSGSIASTSIRPDAQAYAETAVAATAAEAVEVRTKPSTSKKAAAKAAAPTPASAPTPAPAPARQPMAPSVAALSEPISLPSRKKFEETHTRSTFYVENELLDYLNTVAVEKGQKTYIINEALRRFLAAIQTS